jgi:hypothetical protein
MKDRQLDRLVGAIDEYSQRNPYYDQTFAETGDRIRAAGYLTKLDVSALVFWKRMRIGAWATDLLNLADDEIRERSAPTFAEHLDTEERLSTLDLLPGFPKRGGALASAVLSAWDPDRFPVMDRRAWSGMEALFPRESLRPRTFIRYLELVNTIRAELVGKSARGNVTARDIDKGLFILGGP